MGIEFGFFVLGLSVILFVCLQSKQEKKSAQAYSLAKEK